VAVIFIGFISSWEDRVCAQDMQFQIEQAQRLVFPGPVHRRVAQVLRVDDRNVAAALYLEHAIGRNEERGVFVDADAQQKRVIGNRG
jgi:hypothetical protein